MTPMILFAVILAQLASIAVMVTAADDLVIHTSHGKVRGLQYEWRDGSIVNAWRGIPFGQPPVNDLRWRSPKSVQDWDGILNCTTLKSACIQPDGTGDEDCLYLNVYSTGKPKSSKLLPVMFYIYGGSLLSGAANAEYGAFVSHAGNGEGVIVVEVSYRLNILGFLAVAELSQEQGGVSGNYGIQDQVLGLHWVKENIAKFNGDPNLVTICGQSSGGTSVFALLASPSSRGLFHRAISLSGSPNMSLPLNHAEVQNAPILAQPPCANKRRSSTETLACLRGLSPQELVGFIPDSWNTPGLFGLPLDPSGQHWAGLVIVDGVTIPYPFDEALARGDVSSNVPLMIGAMGQECDEWPDVQVQTYSDQEWRKYLIDYFGPWDASTRSVASDTGTGSNTSATGSTLIDATTDKMTVGERLYHLYLDESTQNPQKAFDSLMSDYGNNCANVQISRHALGPLGHYKAPIYHFVNNYHLSKEFVSDPTTNYTVRYASHVYDYLMALEQWSAFDSGRYVPDQRDLQGSALLQAVWYNFMLTGNPTPVDRSAYYAATSVATSVDSFNSSTKTYTLSPWRAVNEVENFPRDYNTYVIQSDDGQESATVQNYHSEKCDNLYTAGISERQFWWCN